MSMNEIVDSIRSSGMKLVAFSVNIAENPDIRTMASGLVSIGFKVVIFTSAKDSIETIRSTKNVSFVLNTVPPTESQNNVNAKNLPLLKEDDELVFSIGSEQDYDDARTFLKGKVMTRPTVIFDVEAFVKADERERIEEKIIADSVKSTCPIRLL